MVNGGTLLHFDGATWRAVSPGFGVGGARLLASATGLLAVTSTEGLWRLNGGAWAQVSLPFSARIGSASVSRDGTLWLINLAGEVWTGSPAALVAVDAGVPIPDVNFARVFALGPGEAILQTAGVQFSLADGGVSPLSLPMNPSVSAVVRTGAATWVFAENGGVLRSP